MDGKTVIYCKQPGEPPTPVTVRVEWQPDGKIVPLKYWTPDGICFKVNSIYEMTPLAFLKDRGEGVRFKIKSEIIDLPEMDENFLHFQYETYLYFADNFFYRKGFVDGRYGHSGKEFISVTLDFFPDAGYELICFHVRGERYIVERKLQTEPRGSYLAGGVGIRHCVEARPAGADGGENPRPYAAARVVALYFEVNKWFVTLK